LTEKTLKTRAQNKEEKEIQVRWRLAVEMDDEGTAKKKRTNSLLREKTKDVRHSGNGKKVTRR